MRWSLLIATLGLAAPAAAQRQEVTLDEAVERALTVQPAMVRARGEERDAGAARRAAYGAFLPSISTSTSALRNSTERRDPNTNVVYPPGFTYAVGLSASLDQFNPFRRLAERSAAGATLNAAQAGVVNQRFQVTLETKRFFYNALATEELVRVAEAQVRRAQQQLQISIEKLRAGSATRSDSLRSTVDYGNARIARLQAQANLATAQANLGRQIGHDQPVRAATDTALPLLPDTGALRARALTSAPQVEQAVAQARRAGAQLTATRLQYLPNLTISYNDNQNGLSAPWRGISGYNETYSWRFGLSWTLFNGFARERDQVNAAVARDAAEADAADTRRRVSAELTQQIATLATAHEQIAIARSNVAAATEDLRVQSERYRVGAATILDLLTSQSALTTAEVSLVQARFAYLIARAQVEALVGRTL
ncbi:MAG TPA: TolC family protein [Gemmatimonadales bacterium]